MRAISPPQTRGPSPVRTDHGFDWVPVGARTNGVDQRRVEDGDSIVPSLRGVLSKRLDSMGSKNAFGTDSRHGRARRLLSAAADPTATEGATMTAVASSSLERRRNELSAWDAKAPPRLREHMPAGAAEELRRSLPSTAGGTSTAERTVIYHLHFRLWKPCLLCLVLLGGRLKAVSIRSPDHTHRVDLSGNGISGGAIWFK